MSHFKERKEKNCLNCNAEVIGRYCYICGQENTQPKQTFGHLVSHFFNDVTHFDGKFFSTLSFLLRRPGFLTREFFRGRRGSYLDPIRMYIFTSAIFFLIFFKTIGHVEINKEGQSETVQHRIEIMSDSSLKAYSIKKYDTALSRDVLMQRARQIDNVITVSTFYKDKYASVAVYDSIQQQLPAMQKDGFMKRYIRRAGLRLAEAQKKDPDHFVANLLNRFLHFFPQILFVSLPLFALLLKFLYLHKKEYYYTDHIIFSIHLYIFTLISMLLSIALQSFTKNDYTVINLLTYLIGAGIFFYQYKAMRTFYQQRRLKTILKFIILNIMSFLLMGIITTLFFIFSSATFE